MDALFPLNTLTVSLSALSTLGSTLAKHYLQRKKITSTSEARNSLLYDEAFSVMKMFFEKSSHHTVEDAQKFGNNFVPAPFWVRVIRVVIPLSTRLEAGKILIAGIGEEDIQKVVGGREWWQRTAHTDTGVDGEWISLKRDWEGLEKEAKAKERAKAERKGKLKSKDEEWEDDLREARLKALKQAAKEDTRRRRREGKARHAASPGSVSATPDTTDSEPETDSDAERERQREAAHAQRHAHRPEDIDDPTAHCHREDDQYTSDMDEMPVIMAIHGGAYFFGSINTHRYVYWRLARKMGGRVFAVEYRLAPQYPFPCGLHDCLSAYLYLIRPPPGAKHRPVDPAKITLCGDSAGGGMTLALLCLLRDVGLPMPAGAILISPWCDLTHSFPSILENTESDIPPPYGFGVFRPSTLWPPPGPEFRIHADNAVSVPGLKAAAEKYQNGSSSTHSSKHRHGLFSNLAAHNKGHELAAHVENLPDQDPTQAEKYQTGGGTDGDKTRSDSGQHKAELAEVIKVKVDGEEIELKDQIQLYATNSQLAYPFVSPVWQPSLGGLPPLYVMAGNKEVLRDEIVYMAHRAAHPDKYPVRKGILEQNPERTAKSKDYPPTKVHLQIYDEVCHDLPLFSFTTPAKYCFRAMASFAKFVTAGPNERPSEVSASGMLLPVERDPTHPDGSHLLRPPSPDSVAPTISTRSPGSYAPSVAPSAAPSSTPPTSTTPNGTPSSTFKGKGKKASPPPIPDLEKTIYSSTQPFNRPEYVDNMIRERVSVTGVVRPMEPIEDVKILKLDPEDIGLIKEAPVKRYLAGKAIWDKKYRKIYIKVQKERERHLKKSMREEATRITKRVNELAKEKDKRKQQSSSSGGPDPSNIDPAAPEQVTDSPEPLDLQNGHRLRRGVSTASIPIGLEGSWDLHGENPPPSSLAGRKDTAEARKLAKVLDEHFSRLHMLNLWSEIHDMVGHAPRHNTEDPRPGHAEQDDDAPSPGVQLGASSP
ncbi:hypothetical protein JCM10207_002339 [Rhodosporidiobolus poonsookiae]